MIKPLLHFVQPHAPLQRYLQYQLASAGYSISAQLEEAQAAIVSLPAPCESAHNGHGLNVVQALSGKVSHLEKMILLSSAEVYGEGDFACGDCGPIPNANRPEKHLQARRWEVICPICGEMMMPLAIPEPSEAQPTSSTGRKILDFEQRFQVFSRENNVPLFTLRLFRPYWPEPSFLQETHGVIAAFTNALIANQPPAIYEDGNSMRDFTHASDILQALTAIMELQSLESGIYNIGSGTRITMFALAALLQEMLHKTDVPYTITDTYHEGDIRHRFADINKAQRRLGYQPQYDIQTGITVFARELLAQEQGAFN